MMNVIFIVYIRITKEWVAAKNASQAEVEAAKQDMELKQLRDRNRKLFSLIKHTVDQHSPDLLPVYNTYCIRVSTSLLLSSSSSSSSLLISSISSLRLRLLQMQVHERVVACSPEFCLLQQSLDIIMQLLPFVQSIEHQICVQ